MSPAVPKLTPPLSREFPAPGSEFVSPFQRWGLPAIVVLACAFRVGHYAHNRSLWLDEAALACNFFERGWMDFLQPLSDNQAAPLGFLWLTKGVTSVFGFSESAFRLVPLIAGIASLPMLGYLALRSLDRFGASFAVLLAAFSSTLVYYSSEFKPYATDVWVSLGLLMVLSPLLDRQPLSHRAFTAAIIGVSLAPWMSFPSVFVIAGILCGAFAESYFARNRRSIVNSGVLIFVSALSFGASFGLSSGQNLSISGMREYWAANGAFMPLGLNTLGELSWFTSQAFGYFETVGGLHSSRNLLLAFALIGGVAWARQARLGWLISCAAPLAFAALASGLKLYPFHSRLLLFSVPGLFLLAGAGMGTLYRLTKPAPFVWVILGSIALFSPAVYTSATAIRGIEVEELRPLVERIKAEPTAAMGRVLVAGDDTAYRYYAKRLHTPEGILWSSASNPPASLNTSDANSLWLVISHLSSEQEADWLRAAAAHNWNAETPIRTTGAVLYPLKRAKPSAP